MCRAFDGHDFKPLHDLETKVPEAAASDALRSRFGRVIQASVKEIDDVPSPAVIAVGRLAERRDGVYSSSKKSASNKQSSTKKAGVLKEVDINQASPSVVRGTQKKSESGSDKPTGNHY